MSERLRHEVEHLLEAGRPDRAFDRLTAVLYSSPRMDELWAARSLLTQVVERLPATAATEARRAAAKACGLELAELQSPIGRAEFPVIGSPGARFLAVQIFETEQKDRITPAGVGRDTAAAVHKALAAARDLTGHQQPLHVSFSVVDSALYGGSCGLAVGIAVVSYLQRIKLPESLLFTGELQADGRVDRVDDVQKKRELRRDCRPGATLLVPTGQEAADECAHPIGSLREAVKLVQSHVEPQSAPSIDVEVELSRVRSEFNAGRFGDAARRAETLLARARLRTDEKLELRTILLAAANHRGEQLRAETIAAEIQILLLDSSLPADVVAHAIANMAVRLIDLLRPEEAELLLDQAERLPLQPSDRMRVHLRGTRARARILKGDLHGALILRQENAERCPPDESARCLGDLADIYIRRGEHGEAESVLQRANRALNELLSSARRVEYLKQTARYLGLYAVRLERARGATEAARQRLAETTRTDTGPSLELGLEAAQLEASVEQRIAAIERIFASINSRDQLIYRAIYLRSRVQAGDASAHADLCALFGRVDLSAHELAARLPY